MTRPSDFNDDQLRRALAVIGEEAGRPDPTPLPAFLAPWWRRRATIAVSLIATAAVCAAVAAIGLTTTDNPAQPHEQRVEAGDWGLTPAQNLACTKTIVVGDVVRVRDGSESGRVVVTMAVQDWIKPDHGPDQVDVDVIDWYWGNPSLEQHWKTQRPPNDSLIEVSVRRDLPAGVRWDRRKDTWLKQIATNLPKSAHTDCPAYWRKPSR